ncbi:MAG TPA: hypothetical protein VFU86_11545 [Terriglobales bacterium]|nr:hypothetical protein [Terriglobales bacterium]
MLTDKTITFITAADELPSDPCRVGLLVEHAPDAPWLPSDHVSLTELLGDPEEAKVQGAELLRRILEDEPEIAGVRHLYALKEPLIRSAAKTDQTLHLHQWLLEHQVSLCRFGSANWVSQRLRELRDLVGGSYTIEECVPAKAGGSNRLYRYLRETGKEGLSEVPRIAVQTKFPLLSRVMLQRRRQESPPDETWFYSTFYTYTKIALAYERSLPSRFRFLISDRGSPELPLRDEGRGWSELCAYIRRSQMPGRHDISNIRRTLLDHFEKARLSDEESIVRELLKRSQEMKEFFHWQIKIGLLETQAFQGWLTREKPRLLVVGNDSFEGYFLQLARKAGLPTLMLQHGIFGDFYQLTEHSADMLLARGRFWQEFVSPESRKRSLVVNCVSPRASAREEQGGRDLLFVSVHYKSIPVYHLKDLEDILRTAAKAAVLCSRRLTIRVHPRETPAIYESMLSKIAAEQNLRQEVAFSTGPSLEQAIRQSSVAMLHSSTVFLDCLRLGVPIVSFDWHDFAYKRGIAEHRAFSFAKDLQHLEELLVTGLRGELKPSRDYEDFLAPTSEDEIRQVFDAAAQGKFGRHTAPNLPVLNA